MSGLGFVSGMGSGLGVAERPRRAEKIEVACGCGKRYRVAAARAGRTFRCKGCSTRLRIPRPTPESLSSHDAQQILAELGIDTSARERFEAEVTCFYCSAPLGKSEQSTLDEGEQPLCFPCRASAGQPVEQEASEPERRPHKELDRWVRPAAVATARAEAARLTALLAIGITGFCSSVLGFGLGGALCMGAAVGAFGGHQTYRARIAG